MLAKFFESQEHKALRLADLVTYRRPEANREFDQIYMLTGDMVIQVNLMQDYLKDKKVVFLGDGDGMSMMFGLFASKDLIAKPNSITVLDFDQRIINNIINFSKEYQFHDLCKVECENYNVIDPVPDNHREKYDFFYINPPYGSKNAGISCETWLHRCLDLCMEKCSGCIVIPYDVEQQWTQDSMHEIQRFLIAHGFVIKDMISYMHSYHLKDNPNLKSATLIVDRAKKVPSEYLNSQLPDNMLVNLYGSPRAIPRYILDDGTQFGKPDYNWKYGKNFWDENLEKY